MSEDAIYHPGPFDRIFNDCVGVMDILEELLGSVLEIEDCEQ